MCFLVLYEPITYFFVMIEYQGKFDAGFLGWKEFCQVQLLYANFTNENTVLMTLSLCDTVTVAGLWRASGFGLSGTIPLRESCILSGILTADSPALFLI